MESKTKSTESKYIESLNYVRDEIKASCWEGNEIYKHLDTLQELIDKYETLRADYIVNGAVPFYIYKEIKAENEEYKKKEKKIVNKKLKRAYEMMKESGYFDE